MNLGMGKVSELWKEAERVEELGKAAGLKQIPISEDKGVPGSSGSGQGLQS